MEMRKRSFVSFFLTTCLPFLFISAATRQILKRPIKGSHPCPQECLLREGSAQCPSLKESRYLRNVSEICREALNERFPSEEECVSRCGSCSPKRILFSCSRTRVDKKYKLCRLKPESGPCKAYFVMWYYNESDADCKTFVYGGCGGNENRFSSHLDCLNRCGLLGYYYPRPPALTKREEL